MVIILEIFMRLDFGPQDKIKSNYRMKFYPKPKIEPGHRGLEKQPANPRPK